MMEIPMSDFCRKITPGHPWKPERHDLEWLIIGSAACISVVQDARIRPYIATICPVRTMNVGNCAHFRCICGSTPMECIVCSTNTSCVCRWKLSAWCYVTVVNGCHHGGADVSLCKAGLVTFCRVSRPNETWASSGTTGHDLGGSWSLLWVSCDGLGSKILLPALQCWVFMIALSGMKIPSSSKYAFMNRVWFAAIAAWLWIAFRTGCSRLLIWLSGELFHVPHFEPLSTSLVSFSLI